MRLQWASAYLDGLEPERRHALAELGNLVLETVRTMLRETPRNWGSYEQGTFREATTLEPLPGGIEVFDTSDGRYDFVQLFVKSISELAEPGSVALKAVTYDGPLWIWYCKRSSKVDTDISRETGWDVISQAGLRPVAQISIDETWSALRFRPAERIGKSR